MSYILEALRKSQLEHARGRVPTLEVDQPSPGGAARRRWVPLLSAMAAGALLAAFGVQQFGEEPMAEPVAAAPSPADALPEKPRNPPPQPAPATVEVQAPAVSAPQPEPKPEPATTVMTPPTPLPAVAEPAAGETAKPEPAVALPTFAWHQMPQPLRDATGPLELNVHVYSDTPGRRFVFINNRRYREGETLREGPVLERVMPNGVALTFREQRFRIDVLR